MRMWKGPEAGFAATDAADEAHGASNGRRQLGWLRAVPSVLSLCLLRPQEVGVPFHA